MFDFIKINFNLQAMNWEGNSMIDCDDGSDSRSPKYKGVMKINVEIREFFLNVDDNQWEYNSTYPLDEQAVSVENLIEWIDAEGNKVEDYPITVIKKHADEVIISQDLGNGEEIKYEMFYV